MAKTILRLPLINELTMLIVCSQTKTTLDEVGEIAHICKNCGDTHCVPMLEIAQRGMFDHDSMTLVMYCGKCFNGTIYTYDIPFQTQGS